MKPEENKKLLTRFTNTNTHTNTHKAMINYSVYMMSNPMDKSAAAKAYAKAQVSEGAESSEPCSPHCRLRPSSSRLHSSIIIFTELHENIIESHRRYIRRSERLRHALIFINRTI